MKEDLKRFIAAADMIFQTKIEVDGQLICKIDKADILEIEERGYDVKEEALKVVNAHSKDGTLASGIQRCAELSKLHDGPAYVGWMLIENILKR